jgi:DNA invertase Pin-like site-specific DNA recombinase
MNGIPWAITLAYMRISTVKQDVTVQQHSLTQHGYDELFTEQISGTRDDRPEFRRLVARALELAQQGCQVTILVLDDTRWSRNVAVSLEAIERLEQWGVRIKTVTGKTLSVATPEQFFQTGLDALLAAKFSKDQSQKAKRSYAFRRKKKRPLSNRVTFGYRRSQDGEKLEPEPAQWPIARELISRFIRGDSNSELIRWLDSEGIQRSDVWIRYWLKNPTIRGHIYERRQDRPGGKITPVILYRNTHQALLSEDEYQSVLKRLDLRRRFKGKNQNAKIPPVPTQIVCCACGRSAGGYSPPKGRGRYQYRYFRCSAILCPHRQGAREDRIEAALQEALHEKADVILSKVFEPDQPIENPELITTREQLAKLRALDQEGIGGLESAIVELEAKIADLSTEKGDEVAFDPEMIDHFRDPLFWALRSDEERRIIYLDWIERVVVDRGEVVEVRVRG